MTLSCVLKVSKLDYRAAADAAAECRSVRNLAQDRSSSIDSSDCAALSCCYCCCQCCCCRCPLLQPALRPRCPLCPQSCVLSLALSLSPHSALRSAVLSYCCAFCFCCTQSARRRDWPREVPMQTHSARCARRRERRERREQLSAEHDKQLQAKQIISIHRLSCAQAQAQRVCVFMFAFMCAYVCVCLCECVPGLPLATVQSTLTSNWSSSRCWHVAHALLLSLSLLLRLMLCAQYSPPLHILPSAAPTRARAQCSPQNKFPLVHQAAGRQAGRRAFAICAAIKCARTVQVTCSSSINGSVSSNIDVDVATCAQLVPILCRVAVAV